MSINYNFVAVPQDMLSILYRKHLTGNQLLVLLAVSEEVLKFPEGRASLTRELACRYIANKINISFQAVSRAIRKLASMGLIEIIEFGKKGIGSLIKLVIPSETNIVASGETYNEKCVASGRTNKRTLIKNVKETNNSVEVVPLNKNINSEMPGHASQGNTTSDFAGQEHNGNISSIAPSLVGEKEEISFTPEKFNNTVNNSTNNGISLTYAVKPDTKNIRVSSNGFGKSDITKPDTDNVSGREVNNTVGNSDTIKDSQSVSHPLPKEEFKELSSVASDIGIKPSLLSTGIKALASRQCHDIRNTMEDIFSQIKSRAAAIKNKAAYFVSLCQNVELEDPPVPSTIENNNSDDNNGFRRPPVWMTGEDELHPEELHKVETPPVDTLQEKRKAFADKISNYFTIGRVKYVLSPAGVPQKIIACSPETLSYVKDGASLRHVDWKNLPEKLLNDVWFVGENE